MKKKIIVKAKKREIPLSPREKARLKLVKILNKAKKKEFKGEKLSASQKLVLEGKRFVHFVVDIEEYEQFMDNECSEKSPNQVFVEYIRSKI